MLVLLTIVDKWSIIKVLDISSIYLFLEEFMKKFLICLLCFSMLLIAFVGCDSKAPAGSTSQDDPTKAQFECGKKAYDELVKASTICEDMGDALYGAWYFAIYEADDYSGSSRISAFASETGLSSSDIYAVGEEMGYNSTLLPYALDDFSTAVYVVLAVYEANGKTEELNTALANAKTELKTMTEKYSDYSQYPSLKSFYSEVDSYATFLKSPSGSFEQLKTTIETYEKSIRTYKSDLSFVFED